MVQRVVIGLTQNRKNAISFGARFFTYSLGDFFLKHTAKKRNVLAKFQNLENNLTGNVVGEVSDDSEGLAVKYF